MKESKRIRGMNWIIIGRDKEGVPTPRSRGMSDLMRTIQARATRRESTSPQTRNHLEDLARRSRKQ